MCALAHTDPAWEAVEALSARLGPPTSDPIPLEGGITNRNFRVSFGESEVVVRVPGRDTSELGIDRAAEAEAAGLAAELGIGPPVAAVVENPRCIAIDFVEGETMEAESFRDDSLVSEVARILSTIHESRGQIPTTFDPFAVVADHADRATKRGAVLPEGWERASGLAARIQEKMSGPLHKPVFTHNDLLPANLIRDTSGHLQLLDWDYAGMGDRFFDLANFAINAELTQGQRDLLLTEYFGEATDANLATLDLMRVMSDLREAMWGVLQGTLSDLDFDFAEYAKRHFARLEATASEPGVVAALEADSIA